MQVQATSKYIRIAPRKTRLVVDLIRGMSVLEARAQLKYSLKGAAKPVLKALNSAMANAEHNEKAKVEELVVEKAFVDEGPTYHRYTPRAQGRATKIRKRMSHVTIVVSDGKQDGGNPEAPKVEVKSKAKKATVKKKPAAKKASTTKKVKPKTKSSKQTANA